MKPIHKPREEVQVLGGLETGNDRGRNSRVKGDLGDRLVLILHLAYAFVPLGFLLSALAALDVIPPSAGIHAWSGAIAAMTLAVMTRASLGHTGQTLQASPATHLLYAAVIVAALSRIAAALLPEQAGSLLTVAGGAWAIAFIGFAAAYGPALCRRTS